MTPIPNQLVLVKLEDTRDGIFYYLGKFINDVWYVYPDCQGRLGRKLRYEEVIIKWQYIEEDG